MKSGFNLNLPAPHTLGSLLFLLVELVPGSMAGQPVAAHVAPSVTNAALGSSVT